MILVIGMPSGGTSLVAGLLHHLGVDMGRFERGTANGTRQYEGFECLDCWRGEERNPFEPAVLLRRLCRIEWPGAIRNPFEPARAERFMQSFVRYLERRASEADGPFGVKHNPLAWLGMFDEIESLPVRIVHVHRPLDEVMASDRRYLGDDLARSARMGMSYLAMNRLLERIAPRLSLTFTGILDDPQAAVDSIIEAFALSPTFEQIEQARDFVNPAMKHV